MSEQTLAYHIVNLLSITPLLHTLKALFKAVQIFKDFLFFYGFSDKFMIFTLSTEETLLRTLLIILVSFENFCSERAEQNTDLRENKQI